PAYPDSDYGQSQNRYIDGQKGNLGKAITISNVTEVLQAEYNKLDKSDRVCTYESYGQPPVSRLSLPLRKRVDLGNVKNISSLTHPFGSCPICLRIVRYPEAITALTGDSDKLTCNNVVTNGPGHDCQ